LMGGRTRSVDHSVDKYEEIRFGHRLMNLLQRIFLPMLLRPLIL
jgi:hypothetical protein